MNRFINIVGNKRFNIMFSLLQLNSKSKIFGQNFYARWQQKTFKNKTSPPTYGIT